MKAVEIKKSRLHGNGVFAGENIRKGETIFIIKGVKKHLIVNGKKDSELGPLWIGLRHGEWIDPKSPASFLNHSCDPTAGIKGAVTLKAVRNIEKGQEITFDYSTTEDDNFWTMNCRCGSNICRHKIGPIQTLPKKYFNKYFPFIPTYFRNLYLRLFKSV